MILKLSDSPSVRPCRALSLLSPPLPQFGTTPSVNYGQFFSGPSLSAPKPHGGPS